MDDEFSAVPVHITRQTWTRGNAESPACGAAPSLLIRWRSQICGPDPSRSKRPIPRYARTATTRVLPAPHGVSYRNGRLRLKRASREKGLERASGSLTNDGKMPVPVPLRPQAANGRDSGSFFDVVPTFVGWLQTHDPAYPSAYPRTWLDRDQQGKPPTVWGLGAFHHSVTFQKRCI